MVTFNRRTNTSDEKFLSGDKVHKGTLGPNRERDGFDAFQAKLRSENPRYEDFYSGSRTFNEVANMSQMKIASTNKSSKSGRAAPRKIPCQTWQDKSSLGT